MEGTIGKDGGSQGTGRAVGLGGLRHRWGIDHPAWPDVTTSLVSSESGMPADPPVAGVSRGFAPRRGCSSNRIPLLIPKVTPCIHPRWTSLCLTMIEDSMGWG